MVKKQEKRNIQRGSFTVEAAGIMPVVILALIAVLYLCFSVHNRVWFTAAAYEAALSGSMEGIRENGKVYETADMRARMLGKTGFFGAENLRLYVTAGNQVQVSYCFDTISGFGGLEWSMTGKGSAKIIRPVKWIRTIKAAAETVKGGN